jgi:putative SOS response-associated peptidase YedK
MCGRYRLSRRAQFLLDHYGIEADLDWEPRYNIAPTQQVPVVRQHVREPKRFFTNMRWGLIPSWANDPSIGASMINARAETAAQKPAFGDSLRNRRCLIPADGFYEWQRRNGNKQPFCFTVGDDDVFSFAGLWDCWNAPDGQKVESCSILTTTPNSVTADVHDRMPVILPPDTYDLWLDPGFTNLRDLTDMLKPYDAIAMRRFAVSTRVNTAANDDESVSKPLTTDDPIGQMSMF